MESVRLRSEKVQAFISTRRPRPCEQLGMNEMRQKFCAVHHSRTRTRKIRVGIHSKHPAIADSRKTRPIGKGRKLARLFNCVLEIETAWSNDKNFRREFHDVIPADAHGILPLLSERIHTSRESDHLWHPMAAAIDRIEPFHTKDARPVW